MELLSKTSQLVCHISEKNHHILGYLFTSVYIQWRFLYLFGITVLITDDIGEVRVTLVACSLFESAEAEKLAD